MTGIGVQIMKIRLLAAVICTAFSFFASGMSLVLMTSTVLGAIAMLTSMFMGLVWAFPAVLLMLHVIKCRYFPPAPISQW